MAILLNLLLVDGTMAALIGGSTQGDEQSRCHNRWCEISCWALNCANWAAPVICTGTIHISSRPFRFDPTIVVLLDTRPFSFDRMDAILLDDVDQPQSKKLVITALSEDHLYRYIK